MLESTNIAVIHRRFGEVDALDSGLPVRTGGDYWKWRAVPGTIRGPTVADPMR